jgi:hypothetical protein
MKIKFIFEIRLIDLGYYHKIRLFIIGEMPKQSKTQPTETAAGDPIFSKEILMAVPRVHVSTNLYRPKQLAQWALVDYADFKPTRADCYFPSDKMKIVSGDFQGKPTKSYWT